MMGMSRQMLSMIIHGHARLSPEAAARLGKLFGNGPGLWLRLQARWDAEHIDAATRAAIQRIPTLDRLPR
jgi:addiction module HigA family antidote